jgi:hypothetical protein
MVSPSSGAGLTVADRRDIVFEERPTAAADVDMATDGGSRDEIGTSLGAADEIGSPFDTLDDALG